jgi:hypothetical protein
MSGGDRRDEKLAGGIIWTTLGLCSVAFVAGYITAMIRENIDHDEMTQETILTKRCGYSSDMMPRSGDAKIDLPPEKRATRNELFSRRR